MDRLGAEAFSTSVVYDEFLEVYRCDPSDRTVALGSNAPALTQGSKLSICAKSIDRNVVDVSLFKNMLLTQVNSNGDLTFKAITDGVPLHSELVVSEKEDECMDGICLTQVQLIAGFFEQNNPEGLEVSG